MLSALIIRREDKSALVAALSKERLMALATAEKNMAIVKYYLAQLIRNAEQDGLEQIMSMFQQGTLRGDEVTELLGNNPRFSYDILSNAPPQQAYQVQLSELARKYPAATGFIKPGMYVNTTGGWGLIESITDVRGHILDSAQAGESVIYNLQMHPLSDPEPAILDMIVHKLIFPGAIGVTRCLKCNAYITRTDKGLKHHNQLIHHGSPMFSLISPHVPITKEPEFTESIQ
jgi:hypothetical protein